MAPMTLFALGTALALSLAVGRGGGSCHEAFSSQASPGVALGPFNPMTACPPCGSSTPQPCNGACNPQRGRGACSPCGADGQLRCDENTSNAEGGTCQAQRLLMPAERVRAPLLLVHPRPLVELAEARAAPAAAEPATPASNAMAGGACKQP